MRFSSTGIACTARDTSVDGKVVVGFSSDEKRLFIEISDAFD
jgi:hypothetical protein